MGHVRELSRGARRAIAASAKAQHIRPPVEFAVSDMMVQMLTRDPRLELSTNTYVDDLSPVIASVDRSEELFRRFVTYLNAVAARQRVSGTRVARRSSSAANSR